MYVREIMTAKVDYVTPTTTLLEASDLMQKDDIGCLPISENERLIGIVTDRDIITRAIAAGKDILTTTVKDVMSWPIKYCYDDDTLESLSENFSKNQLHRLPVLNHDKQLVGIVSLGDLSTKGSEEGAAHALCGICQEVH